MWCGDGDAQCFATLHRPIEPAIRGVVLCNGLGFDGLLAHRTLRLIAYRLAHAGLAVVRFDYPGVGDSSGGDWQPNRLAAWSAGVGTAVELLRESGGIDDVQIMGFRGGAIPAMMYAQDHAGISGLALWAPVVRGRSFVREMQALAKFRSATRPNQPLMAKQFPDDSLEVVGFEFTAQTVADLLGADLVSLAGSVAVPNILILERADTPVDDDLNAVFRANRSMVTLESFDGYLDFMTDDETNALVPERALDCLVDWHVNAPRPTQAQPNSVFPSRCEPRLELVVTPAQMTRGDPDPGASAIVERPVVFGSQLFGVLSQPHNHTVRTLIVIPNTGSVNRCGPGRLHVDWARRWAALGYAVLRLDLGGAGDSPAADAETENQPYAPQRIAELSAVLREVESWPGIEAIVAIGTCSGAFNILRAAIEGSPIGAAVLINPLIFSLGEDHLANARDRAVLSANRLKVGLTTRSWDDVRIRHGGAIGAGRRVMTLLRQGAFRGYVTMFGARVKRSATRLHLWPAGSAPIVQELRSLHDHGLRVVFAFADDEPGDMYLRAIGGVAFEQLVEQRKIEVVRIAGGDHVFSPPASREQLMFELTDWLAMNHPIQSATALRSTRSAS